MFNYENFNIKLETKYLSTNFVYVEDLESTNSFLLNNPEFKEDGTVVLAEYQSKGKGRKERSWVSEKGKNLTFSILLTKKFELSKIQLLSIYSSLAVSKAMENLFQIDTKFKWPNDILVGGRKICGILLENSFIGTNLEKIVVGIGLNVNQMSFPGEYNIAPTSVQREFRYEASRESLLSEIFNIMEEMLDNFPNNSRQMLAEWSAKCSMIGDKINVVGENFVKHGIFEGIDSNGNMILRTLDGEEILNYGEISIQCEP